MYIARRDFFLSGEASYVYNFLTIAVILRRFLLVGPQPKIAKRVAPIKKSELLPGIRCAGSQPGLESSAPSGQPQSVLSVNSPGSAKPNGSC